MCFFIINSPVLSKGKNINTKKTPTLDGGYKKL